MNIDTIHDDPTPPINIYFHSTENLSDGDDEPTSLLHHRTTVIWCWSSTERPVIWSLDFRTILYSISSRTSWKTYFSSEHCSIYYHLSIFTSWNHLQSDPYSLFGILSLSIFTLHLCQCSFLFMNSSNSNIINVDEQIKKGEIWRVISNWIGD